MSWWAVGLRERETGREEGKPLRAPCEGLSSRAQSGRGDTVPPSPEQSSHLWVWHAGVPRMGYRRVMLEISAFSPPDGPGGPEAPAVPSPSCSL